MIGRRRVFGFGRPPAERDDLVPIPLGFMPTDKDEDEDEERRREEEERRRREDPHAFGLEHQNLVDHYDDPELDSETRSAHGDPYDPGLDSETRSEDDDPYASDDPEDSA
jgi:hypothetical protein